MSFVYAAIFLLIGLFLLIKFTKEDKIFALLGAFFILLGIWWLVSAIFPILNLFVGILGNILRIVTVVVLGIAIYYYYNKFYKKR